jgi:hypothetical protein
MRFRARRPLANDVVVARIFATPEKRDRGGFIMTAEVIALLNSCRPTRHFRQRARERHFRRDVEEFIVTFGTAFTEHQRHYLMIVRRDLPREVRDTPLAARADGWIIVMAPNGSILTCYRNARVCKKIRRAA